MKPMRRYPLALMLLGSLLLSTAALAEGGASIASTLDALKGKRATIKLDSGQELTGVVSAVDAGSVRLTELTGMEFFDAVVRVDRIEAVVLRRVKE